MTRRRAREWGFILQGTPGRYNAITDVEGLEVGYSTLVMGEPKDWKQPGDPFARTGVTAILPRGRRRTAVFAGFYSYNGNGEMTGTHWIEDHGFMHGPVMITNTNSVGIVRDTTIQWMLENKLYYPLVHDGREVDGIGFFFPPVAETWDGLLNDTNGFHVKAEHVLKALDNAKTGFVEEGNVGGGTGMMCHEFKGGTGTSSRVIELEDGSRYTVGVLVQANHGTRDGFKLHGLPIGRMFEGEKPDIRTFRPKPGTGSIIVIIATDAPLLPWQLRNLAKRAPLGINRLGAGNEHTSGDIFLAFSTANEDGYSLTKSKVELLSDELINPIYGATADATEEAILNALCMAETMVGREYNTAYSMPVEKILAILEKHHLVNNQGL